MVATEDVRVDGCRLDARLEAVGGDEIVDAPARVLLASLEAG